MGVQGEGVGSGQKILKMTDSCAVLQKNNTK